MAYDSDFEPLLRSYLLRVTHAYMCHTMILPTFASKSLFGDHSFLKRWKDGDLGFSIRTYDEAMAHMSFVWPADLEWPAGIPRPEPRERDFSPRRKKKDAA